MDHAAFQQLAAGAVLDDLDPDERVAFDAHRAGCRWCRTLVDELLDVSVDLSLAVRPRQPPPALAGAVMAAIAAAAPDGETPAPPPIDRPDDHSAVLGLRGPRAAGRRLPVARLEGLRGLHRLDVAALAAAAVLAIVAFGLVDRMDRLSSELTQSRAASALAEARIAEHDAVMAVAVDPAHRAASLHPESLAPAASAIVVYLPGTNTSYLMVDHLPATPAGKVYELWVADAAGVHGLGTYAFDGHGTFVAPLGVDLTRATAAMMTLEPAGGATGAPGPQVVFGEL